MKAKGFRPVTPNIEATAELPRFFPEPLRFKFGVSRSRFYLHSCVLVFVQDHAGFRIRAVGANPDAAKYSGMSVFRNFVLVMTLSGALAGLAGATQVLGTDHWVGRDFQPASASIHCSGAPWEKPPSRRSISRSPLWDSARRATSMQSLAGIPIHIISVIQGFGYHLSSRSIPKEESGLITTPRGWLSQGAPEQWNRSRSRLKIPGRPNDRYLKPEWPQPARQRTRQRHDKPRSVERRSSPNIGGHQIRTYSAYFEPSVVLNKNQYTRNANKSASGKPQLKRKGSGKKRGSSAVASMLGVTGRKPLAFIGPFNSPVAQTESDPVSS